MISKLASAIRNNVVSGLLGYHADFSISIKLIEDDIIDTRYRLIKEMTNLGSHIGEDLLLSVNCIPVDCKDIADCPKCSNIKFTAKGTPHFLIPQTLGGLLSIKWIGSIDKEETFVVYDSFSNAKNIYLKYSKRRKNKPYVIIDFTPNERGWYNGWVFNAPFIKTLSLQAIFKDPRDLLEFNCCNQNKVELKTELDSMIVDQLTLRYLTYYRLLAMPPTPNNHQYTP